MIFKGFLVSESQNWQFSTFWKMFSNYLFKFFCHHTSPSGTLCVCMYVFILDHRIWYHVWSTVFVSHIFFWKCLFVTPSDSLIFFFLCFISCFIAPQNNFFKYFVLHLYKFYFCVFILFFSLHIKFNPWVYSVFLYCSFLKILSSLPFVGHFQMTDVSSNFGFPFSHLSASCVL